MSLAFAQAVVNSRWRRPLFARAFAVLGLTLVLATRAQSPGNSSSLLYQTGFESSEGFQTGLTLLGQGGWVGSDGGGNGLVSGYFDDGGQQAFVGFSPPDSKTAAFVNVWKPLLFFPAPGASVIKFSARMEIIASTNGRADDFRWSFYNTNGARLFSLDFDTSTLDVSYSLDKPEDFVRTGFAFDMLGAYDLEIWMDFRRNLWSAWLNGMVVANSLPITAAGAPLNFGDADAVWAIREPGSPGDNFMVFDDYAVAVENITSIPAKIEPLFNLANHSFVVRVNGTEGLNYSIDASEDGAAWRPLATIKAPAGGVFDFEDKEALTVPCRLFRVRQIP